MVPVGTRWDCRVTSYAAVGATVTHKTAGLPAIRWLEPRCKWYSNWLAGAGVWFKANSPVSPVVHHWYYPVVPGGVPAVLYAAGITRRSTAGPRRHGSWLAGTEGWFKAQLPGIANRVPPVLPSMGPWCTVLAP